MVGCKIRLRKRKQAEWVSGLLRSKFFGSCVDHGELRKNERNLFCIDCNLCFCKHCVTSAAHDCLHRLLQICKYVYHDVVRLHDIQKHLDCSLIQAYKINGEKAVHLNPRPQLKDTKSSKAKGGGTSCEACGRHIQDLPNRFCSIACKSQRRIPMKSDSLPAPLLNRVIIGSNPGMVESSFEAKEDVEQEKKRAKKGSHVLENRTLKYTISFICCHYICGMEEFDI
ncbi:UNVERIFIED_CONTAM: hypothetical protein Sangu_1759700 [Sesamum angustifolium]|uniref:B box-type domain-containing protein n=1 Tax=Sesamum angustifolium TaxID=2727405 RepID=A0AAW2M8Z2_9LAMI